MKALIILIILLAAWFVLSNIIAYMIARPKDTETVRMIQVGVFLSPAMVPLLALEWVSEKIKERIGWG